jgi:dTDP-4-dehydrorhamnose 3,5-epimerase-like enzyme
MKKIKLIKGDIWKDHRGQLKFINNFDFPGVVRFYEVKASKKEPIRAFHGHLIEEKFVYVISGSILMYAIKLNKIPNPTRQAKIEKFILSENNPQILFIPAGYANGFKILKANSRVIFFSTLSVKDSAKDDYRFDQDYWGEKIWKVNK